MFDLSERMKALQVKVNKRVKRELDKGLGIARQIQEELERDSLDDISFFLFFSTLFFS